MLVTEVNGKQVNRNYNLEKRVNLYYRRLLLTKYFIDNGIKSFNVVDGGENYYDFSLKQRQQILNCHSTEVMCKSIILENKNFDESFASKFYKRYYMCTVQYTNEFNADKIAKLLKKRQNDNCSEKLSNKYFHFRLAQDNIAFEMTGYYYNCICPYLMKCSDLEILFPSTLLKIYPYYFWLGGGEIELKVGISIFDFFKLFNDYLIVGDISNN